MADLDYKKAKFVVYSQDLGYLSIKFDDVYLNLRKEDVSDLSDRLKEYYEYIETGKLPGETDN